MSDQPGQAVRTPRGYFASAVSDAGDPDDGFSEVAAQLRRRRPAERPSPTPSPAAPEDRRDNPGDPAHAPGPGDPAAPGGPGEPATGPAGGDTPPTGSPEPPAPADRGPVTNRTGLAPEPPSDQHPDPARPAGAAADPASNTEQAPGRRRRREDRAGADSGAASAGDRSPRPRGGNRNLPVVLQMSSELAVRAKAHCRDHKVTHAELVFLAVDASSERLTARTPQTPQGPSLFTPQRPTREHSDSSLTQFPAQMRVDNVEVLDQLVERYGFGSRSALVRTCIAAYLDQRGAAST